MNIAVYRQTHSECGPEISPLIVPAIVEQLNGDVKLDTPIRIPGFEELGPEGHYHQVNDEFGGEVIWIRGLNDHNDFVPLATRQIMSRVGYLYDLDPEGDLICAWQPNPHRFQMAAAENRVPIEFNQDGSGGSSATGQKIYISSIMRNKHPVKLDRMPWYEHDTNTDHLPAVIVCGDDLFDYINSSRFPVSVKGDAYDRFSSRLSLALKYLALGETDSYQDVMQAPYNYLKRQDLKETIQLTSAPDTEIYLKAHTDDPPRCADLEGALIAGIKRLGLTLPKDSIQHLGLGDQLALVA